MGETRLERSSRSRLNPSRTRLERLEMSEKHAMAETGAASTPRTGYYSCSMIYFNISSNDLHYLKICMHAGRLTLMVSACIHVAYCVSDKNAKNLQ